MSQPRSQGLFSAQEEKPSGRGLNRVTGDLRSTHSFASFGHVKATRFVHFHSNFCRVQLKRNKLILRTSFIAVLSSSNWLLCYFESSAFSLICDGTQALSLSLFSSPVSTIRWKERKTVRAWVQSCGFVKNPTIIHLIPKWWPINYSCLHVN